MKILIIGSGLIGITTAWFLRRRGHEVTVLDRAEGPGLETSFANAGLLTAGMAEPWNMPGSWRVLLASLGRSDAALQLRLKALPSLAGWGMAFLRNSRPATFEQSARSNLRLALYSLCVMEQLRKETGIEYGHAAPGSLKIFRDPAALDQAAAGAERLLAEGLGFRKLSPVETVELEPALAPIEAQLAGALHYEVDETGDAYRFCVALAGCARARGVDFRFGTPVSSLETRAGRVTAAVSEGRRFEADRYLVAAGSYSTPLLRSAGVRLPVQPAKGYSVTFNGQRAEPALRIPVIDDHLHAALVPLDGALRVAGTAEFAGYDHTLHPGRIQNLIGLVRQVLPQSQYDLASARPWCGLRAMSADGVPIIGPTRLPNLFVNTGHGHLGWTMAAGSAQLLSELIAGEAASVDPSPYHPNRFA
jgi:D-amino-acid dehydrogenase